MRVRHLKLLYVLGGLLWTGYLSVELLAYHIAERIPVARGTAFCLLLFAAIPTIGYILLFSLAPRVRRFLRS
jgi:hypothetical protein